MCMSIDQIGTIPEMSMNMIGCTETAHTYRERERQRKPFNSMLFCVLKLASHIWYTIQSIQSGDFMLISGINEWEIWIDNDTFISNY